MADLNFGDLLRHYRELLPGPPTKANRFRGSVETASVQAVAARAGIDGSYLCMLESGKRGLPRRWTVEALTVALELDERETDRLLVAAGFWPWSFGGVDLDALLDWGRRAADHHDSMAESAS